MEKKVVVTNRFRNNTLRVYKYLLKEFSANIAYTLLDQLEQRLELIARDPTIGKPSAKKKNVQSIILSPIAEYFTGTITKRLRFFAFLI